MPESEIRRFVDRLPAPKSAANGAARLDLDKIFAAADEALTAGDLENAGTLFSRVLQAEPQNARAMVGAATIQFRAGDADRARQILAMLPPDAMDVPGQIALEKALKLAKEAQEVGGAADLLRLVETNPNDHQTRFELALALNAEDRRSEAATELMEIIRRDREWDEDGARKKLLELFEAWGPRDAATIKGRRQLSALLFS
jgi:putative thioredoxin